MAEKPRDVEAIYNAALKKAGAQERSAYLDEVCGEDHALRTRVEVLLDAAQEVGDFLEAPVLDPVATLEDAPLTEGPGTVIGRYKLLEQIGEGGFGVVYMADQTKPISRRVALKIIKLGMDTKQVIARFEAERQALAMMEHPNIAKVLDAGATDTGRPYFVMELVKGIPITEYCDKNNLDTQQRLELFIDVCKAIQHAHQKGIIHRDLKPSNVLITLHDGRPVPKVIDFGIAKATAHRLTEKTLFTRFAQMIGTPEYMSPEQAEFSGLDVDARSDIYSLGVLLYQLLTGVTPFDAETLREAGYNEMQRIIREEEPDKPSTRLSVMGQTLADVAKHRQASPDVLRKLVRGDLDWIVMKTLEKDRTRRYERAVELAADVKRHLNHEPVLAVAPSVSYRLRKFVRRNRVAVITCSLITAALAIGAAITALTLLSSGRLTAEIDESEFARAIREHLEQLEGGEEAKLVWTYPALLVVMSPSPDGRFLAFRDADTGDLAIRDLETGKNRRLTHNEVPFEGTTEDVRFSPDGKWIVYNWYHNEDDEEEADLRIIGIDGSGMRIVYQPGGRVKRISPYAWFPDGRQILGRLARDDGTRQAVVVSVADGSVRVIEGPDRDYAHLSLSPDGRYIAYDFRAQLGSRQDDIALLPVEGGPEVPVIEHSADDDLLGWAPDGRTLLFRSDRRGEGDDAWVVQIIDGKPQGLPQLVKKATDKEGTVANGQFTRDGSFYYPVAKRPPTRQDVCIATLDAGTGRILAPPKHASQRRDTRWPAWSPDGKYLAYYGSSEGGGQRIVVIRSMETGQEREIPLGTKLPVFAARAMHWSPDGRSILTSQQGGGLLQLDVASGKFTPIVPVSGGQRRPAGWSPDGKKVYYGHYNNKSTQVLVRNLEDGEEMEIYRGEGAASISPSFALSPDGQQLAFGSPWFPGKGVTGLHVIPTTGGEPRELLREPDSEELIHTGMNIRGRGLQWTPDGRYVLFIRGNYVNGELWRIAVEGGKPERLHTLAASRGFFLGLRVHPDGKRIAFFSMTRADQELYVIKNFLPDLASPDDILSGAGRPSPFYQPGAFDYDFSLPDLDGRNISLKDLRGKIVVVNFFGTWGPGRTLKQLVQFHKAYRERGVEIVGVACERQDGPPAVDNVRAFLKKNDVTYSCMMGDDSIRRQGPKSNIIPRTVFIDQNGEVRLVLTGYLSRRTLEKVVSRLLEGILLVELESLDRDTFDATESVRLKAETRATGNAAVAQVEFLVDGSPVATDVQAPYEATWQATTGRHVLAARAFDGDGHEYDSHSVSVFVGIRGLERSVKTSEDDTEERPNGTMIRLTDSDLDLGQDERIVGIRFSNIQVPKGARIKQAFVQFTAQESDDDPTGLTIHAELAASGKEFTAAEADISSRKRTKASVKWSPEPWDFEGQRSAKQLTPDLSSLIQKVVAQPDWQEGNALVLIFTGSGERDAFSFDGGGQRYAPMLHVEY